MSTPSLPSTRPHLRDALRRLAARSRGLPARLRRRLAEERGAETAEYAIATLAAVAFAGLLVTILQGDEVRTILEDLVRRGLTYQG